MSDDKFDTIAMVLGNLFLFSIISYAVFILGHSGWWFAFLIIFHFSKSNDK